MTKSQTLRALRAIPKIDLRVKIHDVMLLLGCNHDVCLHRLNDILSLRVCIVKDLFCSFLQKIQS